MRRAASRADWTAGRSSAIRTAMIAITTSSSIRVKPRRFMGKSSSERETRLLLAQGTAAAMEGMLDDHSRGALRRDQYESEESTSPPPTVPSERQVWKLIEFLIEWTLPSANRALTPPG